MANQKIKLYYFDLSGRAEISRLVLNYAEIPFEDIRFSQEKWPEYKPLAPFGQAPFAEIDGKVYGQSLAIAQYFAREANLYGKTNLDALKIDQFSQLIEDFFKEVVKAFVEKDPAKKADISQKLKEEAAPKFLGFANKLLEDNGGQHLAGNSTSLADIVLYDVGTGFVAEYTKDALEKFPLLQALINKIGNNDRIKAYKQSLK